MKSNIPPVELKETPAIKDTAVRSHAFTNVKTILYINYDHGLNSGEYVYTNYSIKQSSREFTINVRYRSGEKSQFFVPYTKEDIKNSKDSSKEAYDSLSNIFSSSIPGHYFSEKEIYNVNDTDYIIYRHINFNCYDPFCVSKHNHGTFETGVTYFSPDYGILITTIGEMQVEVMKSIKEKTVPYDLILTIMKEKRMDKKIIWQYKQDTK